MTNDLEARLRAAVQAQAAATQHDSDSLTAIRARVRSARRRRHTLALLGAVALMVAVAAVPRMDDDHQKVTTADQPKSETTTTTGPVTTTTPSTETTAATDVAPPPAETVTTTLRHDGDAGPGCVNGWTTPTPGTALRVEPLDAIRAEMGVTGEFHVLDMRYFTGPEVPWIIEPRRPLVEWWYVKAQLVDDPTFQARWLVVRRSPGVEGITAVARFDTTGYQSPDWRAFIGEGEPRAIEGLPGAWVGIEFDFTRGEDNEKPGLPDENTQCLDNT